MKTAYFVGRVLFCFALNKLVALISLVLVRLSKYTPRRWNSAVAWEGHRGMTMEGLYMERLLGVQCESVHRDPSSPDLCPWSSIQPWSALIVTGRRVNKHSSFP